MINRYIKMSGEKMRQTKKQGRGRKRDGRNPEGFGFVHGIP